MVLSGIRLVRDVEYTGPRQIDAVGAALSVIGMGGVVLGILVWQEGGESVVLLIALGASALALFAWWLVKRKRAGHATLIDPDLFRFPHFRIGISQTMMQQITLGGTMIALPLFLQMTLEYDAMQAGARSRRCHSACSASRCSPARGPGSGARPTLSWSGSS